MNLEIGGNPYYIYPLDPFVAAVITPAHLVVEWQRVLVALPQEKERRRLPYEGPFSPARVIPWRIYHPPGQHYYCGKCMCMRKHMISAKELSRTKKICRRRRGVDEGGEPSFS